jgi:hypothetical protein
LTISQKIFPLVKKQNNKKKKMGMIVDESSIIIMGTRVFTKKLYIYEYENDEA